MTPAQRERYRVAWTNLLGELTTLDAMIHDYPTPDTVIDPALIFELEDLGRQLNALTTLWADLPY